MKNIKNYDEFLLEKKKHLDPDAEVRNRGNVALPADSKFVKDSKDHFPMNSISQSRNALARVHQYDTVPEWFDGTLKELQEIVVKKVHSEYPEIEIAELEEKE